MSNSEIIEGPGQAEHWYVQLQRPDCSDADRAACLRWRTANDAHEAAFREVQQLWRQSEGLRGHAELDAMLRAEEVQERRASRWRFWFWPPLVAAAAVVFAVFTFVLPHWDLPLAVPGERFETAIGEQRHIELPDGSTVILDTNSVMVVRYSEARRLIELETGQASFTVAHNASRPFRVESAGGAVTALGTHFLVRTESAVAGAVVTLLEGKVRVDGPQTGAEQPAPVTLSPGQQLHFDRAGRWTSKLVDLQVADAWTRGAVYADGWRLADLLNEMNRYSTTQVQLGDPSLAELRVSGTFRTGDPQALAKVLALSWPVRAVPQGEHTILLTPRVSKETATE